ncbi:MAG: hypothetical protein QOH10_1147 [Actinomycetota bacterium]|nr:hypothetical protein [Actinomycetota bacterium]
MSVTEVSEDPGVALQPYLPRLVVEWAIESPETRWRAVDGTFVFADISGFTRMSERLARFGRVGAEEVTDAINQSFAALLEVAYADGGGLVKFGGDAMLLLFAGAGHEHRAARSAAGMRARLRTAGRIVTSAGHVTLRMSVGAHSGTFHCFLVGGSSRELLVVGEAASRVVAMEHAATAGRIVLSPELAAALPESSRGAGFGPGVLLRRAPEGLTSLGTPAVPPLDSVDLSAVVPELVREHALAGGGEPEHRTVTVGFVRYDGLDARLVHDGPDRVAQDLDDLVRVVQEACARHEVALLTTDVDQDGGKIVLTAGAPRAHGDDEERMLDVARRIIDARTEIPVRIGVHRGPVFAGDVGPPYRRTYTVMGDTVNLAARLMAAADPGQILTTAAVLDHSRGFEAEPLPPLQVKGKRAPVSAFSVGRAVSRGRRRGHGAADRYRLPLVGRDSELALIDGLLDSARDGRGGVVVIVGPAGIGKSRLIEEIGVRAPDFQTATAVCEPYEATTPYAPLWGLLRELLLVERDASADEVVERLRDRVAELAPDLTPWLPLVATPLDVEIAETDATRDLAPQFRRRRVAEVTAQFLRALLPGPRVVVFDDVQWSDDVSWEVIERLAAGIFESPWLLVCTRREGTSELEHSAVLNLAPLEPADAVTALRRATEAEPLRPFELEALVTRADGSPLFLTELLAVAHEAGSVGALPDSIEGLVTAQVDRLPPRRRTLLRCAAVLGRSFERAELDALIEGELPPTDEQTWNELSDFINVESATRCRFRHALIRDAAYEELSFRRRRELHARAARRLEASLGEHPEAEAELLSLHYFNARAFPETWRYARIAGARARAKFANVDAAVLFERALSAARQLPEVEPLEVAEVWEALGDVRERSGVYDGAAVAYRSARQLVRNDPAREAAVLLKQAWIPERLGRYSEAIRWVRKGQRTIDGVSEAAAGSCRAQLAAWYGAIRQAQGRSREAIEWCRRAIDEAVASHDPAAEAHASFILDWAYVDSGRSDLAVHSARALALYEELGNLNARAGVLNNLGGFAYYEGRWDDAIDLYSQAHDAYVRAGNATDGASSSTNIAEVLADQGRLEEAAARLRESLSVYRSAGYRYGIAWATSLFGRMAARSGDFDEAQQYFADARSQFAAAELDGDMLQTDVWIVEAMVLAGDPATLAHADDIRARAAANGGVSVTTPALERVRGYALAQLNDWAAARAAFEASLEAARARDADYEVALTLDALARLGALQGEDVAALETESRTMFERLGVRRVVEVPFTSR